MRGVHLINAWYVRLYNALPDCIKPWDCQCVHIGYDHYSYCEFVPKE